MSIRKSNGHRLLVTLAPQTVHHQHARSDTVPRPASVSPLSLKETGRGRPGPSGNGEDAPPSPPEPRPSPWLRPCPAPALPRHGSAPTLAPPRHGSAPRPGSASSALVSAASQSRDTGRPGRTLANSGEAVAPSGKLTSRIFGKLRIRFSELNSFWTGSPRQPRCVSASRRAAGFQKAEWSRPRSAGLPCGGSWPRRGPKRGLR